MNILIKLIKGFIMSLIKSSGGSSKTYTETKTFGGGTFPTSLTDLVSFNIQGAKKGQKIVVSPSSIGLTETYKNELRGDGGSGIAMYLYRDSTLVTQYTFSAQPGGITPPTFLDVIPDNGDFVYSVKCRRLYGSYGGYGGNATPHRNAYSIFVG